MQKLSIIEKVKALMAKTVENGATPEETIAAAAKAQELIEKYQIDQSELHGRYAIAGAWTLVGQPKRDIFVSISRDINKFCGTRGGLLKGSSKVIFYGAKDDVAFASSLYDTFKSLRDREYAAFKKNDESYASSLDSGISAFQIRKQFTLAFIKRIEVMIDEVMKSKNPTSNALVVIKDEVLEAMESAFGMKSSEKNFPAVRDFQRDVLRAGYKAGEKASLSKQVASEKPYFIHGALNE